MRAAGRAVGQPGADVLDQDRAGLGAVGLPQLAAVDSVIRGEVDKAAVGGQGIGRSGAGAGADVLDQDRAGGRGVGFPELQPVNAVVGEEVDRGAKGGELLEGADDAVLGALAGVDVFDLECGLGE